MIKIKKKEILLAISLTVLISVLALHFHSIQREREETFRIEPCGQYSRETKGSYENKEYEKIYIEEIRGKLIKGSFESVVMHIEALSEESKGYVESMSMSYKKGLWQGSLKCKIPPSKVSSFTFHVRATIENNGTVTHINIQVQSIAKSEEDNEQLYSTITIWLEEVEEIDEHKAPTILVQIAAVLPVLETSLIWVAQALILSIPLCFVSLGIVMLFAKGIIPFWRKQLRK